MRRIRNTSTLRFPSQQSERERVRVGECRYFTYNDVNLVTTIEYPGGVANYFWYDAMMRRYAMQDSSGLRYFTWDTNGMNLLCERDSAGAVTAYYTHGFAAVDGIGSGVGQKLNQFGATYHEWDICDNRGTVHKRVDASGNTTGSFEYNAWGESLQEEETGARTRFRYQSNWMKLVDAPNGDLYLSPTRVYKAGVGRFLGKDPLFRSILLGLTDPTFAAVRREGESVPRAVAAIISSERYISTREQTAGLLQRVRTELFPPASISFLSDMLLSLEEVIDTDLEDIDPASSEALPALPLLASAIISVHSQMVRPYSYVTEWISDTVDPTGLSVWLGFRQAGERKKLFGFLKQQHWFLHMSDTPAETTIYTERTRALELNRVKRDRTLRRSERKAREIALQRMDPSDLDSWRPGGRRTYSAGFYGRYLYDQRVVESAFRLRAKLSAASMVRSVVISRNICCQMCVHTLISRFRRTPLSKRRRWLPWHNCRSWVKHVLKACKLKPDQSTLHVTCPREPKFTPSEI